MKKVLKFIIVICILFAAFSINIELQNIFSHDQEDVVGTFKNVTIFPEAQFTLNNNGTYDSTEPSTKGTFSGHTVSGPFGLPIGVSYEIELDDGRTLKLIDNGMYYDGNKYISGDEEYGLEPTFDDNGKSDQSFWLNYESYYPDYGDYLMGDPEFKILQLDFSADGTYSMVNSDTISDGKEHRDSYEGTYELKDNIITLNYDGGSMPLIYEDDRIYFDVYEKQE